MLQIRWNRSQSNSCSKSVGIEAINSSGNWLLDQMFQSNSCSKPVGIKANQTHAPNPLESKPNPIHVPNLLESSPIHFMFQIRWNRSLVLLVCSSWPGPPGLVNPIHVPNPLGSKPIQFMFQIRWNRSQSNSCSKSVGIERNPGHLLHPLESKPKPILRTVQIRWNRSKSK